MSSLVSKNYRKTVPYMEFKGKTREKRSHTANDNDYDIWR